MRLSFLAVGVLWACGVAVAPAYAGEDAWEVGFARYRAGDWAGAVAVLEPLVAAHPDDWSAQVYLAESRLRLQTAASAEAASPGGATAIPLTAPEVAAVAPVAGDTFVPGAGPVEPAPPTDLRRRRERREDRRVVRGLRESKNPRKDRHFGFGIGFLGPAGSFGVFSEVTPFSFLSAEVGWGLGTAVIQTWWAEVKFLPVQYVVSPMVSAGVVGLFGVVRRETWEHWHTVLGPAGERLLDHELHPFVSIGMMVMNRRGFSNQFAVGFAATGDRTAPVFVFPGYRMGWHF